MTTTTSRTTPRAPATVGRARLTLVAAPGRSAARDERRGRRATALRTDVPGTPAEAPGTTDATGGTDLPRATDPDRLLSPGRATGDAERRDWVRRVLGVTVAVHARGPAAHGPDADGAVRSMFAELSAVERLVGADRPGSQLTRLARGDLALADAHPVLRELHELCVAAHVRTDGAVDAWAGDEGPDGVFAPGGLVTTWALERAARHLAGAPGLAFAVEAGGDLLLRGPQSVPARASAAVAPVAPGPTDVTAPGVRDATGPGELPGLDAADGVRAGLGAVAHARDDLGAAGDPRGGSGPLDGEPWHVEIEHPRDRRLVLATLPVTEGGVATAVASDVAPVVDLRSGIPEPTVLAATVVGPSLVWSDVWARAAVAHGTDAVEWVATLRGTRGLLALADGTVHRWHVPG